MIVLLKHNGIERQIIEIIHYLNVLTVQRVVQGVQLIDVEIDLRDHGVDLIGAQFAVLLALVDQVFQRGIPFFGCHFVVHTILPTTSNLDMYIRKIIFQ